MIRWWRTRRHLPTWRRKCERRLEGRLFVAHNARFDYGFLRAEFRRLGVQVRRACVVHREAVARALCGACAPQPRHPDGPLRSLVHGPASRTRRRAGVARVDGGDGEPARRRRDARGSDSCAARAAFAAAPAAGTRRRLAGRSGRVLVPRRRRDAAVRRQEPQHPQSCVRSLRRRAPLRQGIETDAAGPPGRVGRDGGRARGAAARVAPGEGTLTDRQSPPAPSRRRLRRPPAP